MAILNFTLGPESFSKLHDALVCLGKFSEAISIEASHDKLVLTALNTSKSAYASFKLTGNKFFSKYQFKPPTSGTQAKDKFYCKIYNKALLSVFKGRGFDPTREKDTAIEKCEISVEDGEGKKSRFVVKIVCRHGVIKTYRLTFESVAPMHAFFDRAIARNSWSISSRTLREFVEHFGSGTEQLDIYSEDGRVSLTSYTEKIMSGSEILKQPLRTTIAIDTLEFAEFSVEEQLHIVISVKDFKSIITHAGITNTIVKALYSRPQCPMQLTYSDEGMTSEFILMTTGEVRGLSQAPTPNASRAGSKRPVTRQPLEAKSNSEMPPPPASAAPSRVREDANKRAPRPSPPPPQPSIQANELFMSQNDEDRRWDPVNDDDDETMLLWDTGEVDNNPMTMNSSRNPNQSQSINGPPVNDGGDSDANLIPTQRLPPTQRLSEVKGIFD
ncbi:DNA repair protein rad9 [Lachnellula subtilissima]|uniref:DNA repair protein rad9 n=1 Tax=Lachnellula subtilissima TaxID=602034 RepID=A0A8H8U917_9HELO|nr:DNA repair protein rad9 [Lachnellula subtilissima]